MLKNFRLNILVRVAILTTLALALAFVLVTRQMLFVPVVLGLCIIITCINLIHYIEKSNKNLTHFLMSIRQGAFTELYRSGNRGKPFEELSEALNEVITEFAKLNEEKEVHYQYLQALNENIGVAILSFDGDGKLLMMNTAAKSLFKFPAFSSLEHFKHIDTNLYEEIIKTEPDEKKVVKAYIREEQLQLSVQMKEIMLQNKRIRILLLQNINSELEDKEIEAWHQLMRVLTHEIMNSVTPIVSLTDAMNAILKNHDDTPKDFSTLKTENIDDVLSSLSTISSRSKGLLRFVNTYKEYAKPIELHMVSTNVVFLVKRMVDLLTPDLRKFKIELAVKYSSESIQAKADVAMIEQVLINILKNAIEAVAHDDSGKITIVVSTPGTGATRISIADNGVGIDEETMARIFIPFFTTKPNGTGIGLSLSRQIMKMHNGTLKVQSVPAHGSMFTMEWR